MTCWCSPAGEGEVVVLPEDIDLQAVVTEIEQDLALTLDTAIEPGAVAHCDPAGTAGAGAGWGCRSSTR